MTKKALEYNKFQFHCRMGNRKNPNTYCQFDSQVKFWFDRNFLTKDLTQETV